MHWQVRFVLLLDCFLEGFSNWAGKGQPHKQINKQALLGMPSKKPVKFGTLAQKVGGGQTSIPNFCHILIGTNNVGGRGLKGSCHKIIQ